MHLEACRGGTVAPKAVAMGISPRLDLICFNFPAARLESD
jgi:hypothetical protein